MEQIIVIHPDGTTLPLVTRGRTSGVTKAEQNVALLGEDTVSLTVKTTERLDFYLGDRIDVFGKVYTLNQPAVLKKTGTRRLEYTLTFEGVQYELIDAQWLLSDDTVLDSFMGNVENFLRLLVANANRVFPNRWAVGVFPADTEYKTLTFSGRNCLEVLQSLCGEYNTEFEITQANGVRTINLKTAGVNFPYTFRYGRTGGLYELTRQNISSKNVVTRLYVYGGSNNLGSNYRHSKLCLPGKNKNASYIENAAAVTAFGLKENIKTFEKIFPNRYGQVTAAGSKYFGFIDRTMNFDLNEKEADGVTTKWLINGVTAKIKMTSGNLAGYEFDLHKYDPATKEIQVVPFTDENGMKFPSETSAAFQFSVGDTYFFTDINLPDSYKTDSEAQLLEEGTDYYNQYCQPQVQYGLNIAENFLAQFAGQLTVANLFAVGDYIPIEDEDLGVNKSVRIMGFTRDLLHPYKYSITLGDSVQMTAITRIISDLQKVDEVIKINDLADPAKARRNWRAAQEVLANIFDPDGHYYTDKIKPLSIETQMLAVGARSQQFVLQNSRFEPNYEGNANVVYFSGGSLIHYTIIENAVKSWELASTTISNLATATPYYIYARCEKAGAVGSIMIDTVQRTVDSDATYYYFLIGSLSSVITDAGRTNPARLISLTYGSSTINGRFINTGRIQSSGGGVTYFDLDTGEIGGVIKFVSADGTTKNVADLDSTAQETKDYINNTMPGVLSEIQLQLDGKIETWFQTTDPAASWTKTLKKSHVGDMWFRVDKNTLWRYSSSYTWQQIQDQKAIDAYNAASQAQDTADGKRQVFVDTPKVPYDIGDLWVDGKDLRRCITKRTTGSYIANDWVVAVNYDNTKTVIDGGLVTSGTIQVAGDTNSILAGITGNGKTNDSVRFWAGDAFENRANASFRVQQDGTTYMTKANVSGVINATSGKLGAFTIDENSIHAGYGGFNEAQKKYFNKLKFYVDRLFLESGGEFSTIGHKSIVGPNRMGLFRTMGFYHQGWHKNNENEKRDVYIHKGSCLLCINENNFDDKELSNHSPNGNFAFVNIGDKYHFGQSAFFETGYIGKPYSDTILKNFTKTHTFIFMGMNGNVTMYLPSLEDIKRELGTTKVTFVLTIVKYQSPGQRMNLVVKGSPPLLYNSDSWTPHFDWFLGHANIVRLRYFDGTWGVETQNWNF